MCLPKNLTITMFKALIFIVLCLPIRVSSADKSDQCIEFLAGFQLITADKTLSNEQSKLRINHLFKISNVSLSDVQAFIVRYYNKPKEWKLVQDKIVTLLTVDTSEKKTENDTIQKPSMEQKHLDNKHSLKKGS